MKKHLLAIAIITAVFAKAQTFTQNFSSTTGVAIPVGWFQNNVDNKTVASALSTYSFTNKAWVTRNMSASTDPATAAHGRIVVSTSYYTPAGVSNDWLITPTFSVPANGVLTWAANAPDASYPDGYLVKISTTGTTTTSFSTTLLTVAAETSTWNTRSINLNAYAGQTVQIAFVNNSNDMYLLWLDDISLVVPAPTDLILAATTPTGLATFGSVGANKTITAKVKNNGFNNVTAFTAKYSDGVVTATRNVTGLNLSYGQTANVTFTTPYTIPSANESNLKVWVELTGDATQTNDTLTNSIKGYSFMPSHKVVFEEGTGTWCGWCPRGTVYMDSMYKMHPNTTALIAVHNGDPMVHAAYDSGIGTLISGYPTALCGRAIEELDPSDMFDSYAAHLNDFSLGNLVVTPTYNSGTRVADVVVNTQIACGLANNNSANDYRLAIVFTEDNVAGTTSAYNQVNYYSSASQNQPLDGAGRDWQTSPNPVPAASIHYDFVARTILGGFTGAANSLPSTLVAGTTYTSSVFSYTVPAAYNASKMTVHALLVDAKTNMVFNANSTPLSISTGIKQLATEKISADIYPNPATNNATIELNLVKEETVTVNVLSLMGQVIYTETLNKVPAGIQTINLNTENWTNGIYNVNISTANGSVSHKLDVIK
ncbi:MAG: hagA 1 [Bacteroidetes bacterium]|jgi:hypothetical protein|nr:hagA 1 [Bacteroidota bacterium]MDF2450968.1 hagA 1 [Bacteroidota bacterium]